MMRRHDWTGFMALAALILSLVELLHGTVGWAFVWFLIAAAAGTPAFFLVVLWNERRRGRVR